jgi:hypothetical protein
MTHLSVILRPLDHAGPARPGRAVSGALARKITGIDEFGFASSGLCIRVCEKSRENVK